MCHQDDTTRGDTTAIVVTARDCLIIQKSFLSKCFLNKVRYNCIVYKSVGIFDNVC